MKLKRLAAALLCAGMVLGLTGMTAMADTEVKITSVSLIVKGNLEIEGSIRDQEVEITTKSDKYTVGEYEFVNTGFTWSEEDIPELKVNLYAEDGYKFSVSSDKITLKGADYVSFAKEDSYHTLIITMKLKPMAEQTGEIERADWTALTVAGWSESVGAGSYELKLYRGGKSVGATKITETTSYDFSNAMTKEGTYSYRVRPVNRVKAENKGEWVESPAKYIDADTAAFIYQNRSATENGAAGSWKQDETGWWYANADGSYTVSNWQQINGKWYFFNDRGYMATGWVDWNGARYYCDLENGDMLSNTVTPDGYTVGADGALLTGF